mgnify:CR=1 FL=1
MESKESPKKLPASPSRSPAIKSKESPKKKVAAEAKNIKVEANVKKTGTKSEPKKEEKPNAKRKLDVDESGVAEYDRGLKIKQEDGEEQKPSPVKTERRVSESPNKLPTYATMIKKALEEMNVVGGEGCTKLEILL